MTDEHINALKAAVEHTLKGIGGNYIPTYMMLQKALADMQDEQKAKVDPVDVKKDK